MQTINEKIEELRRKRKMSQRQMASELKMAHNNYSRLERGEIQLTINKLIQICEILSVEPIYFFLENDEAIEIKKTIPEIMADLRQQYKLQGFDISFSITPIE